MCYYRVTCRQTGVKPELYRGQLTPGDPAVSTTPVSGVTGASGDEQQLTQDEGLKWNDSHFSESPGHRGNHSLASSNQSVDGDDKGTLVTKLF